MIGILIATGGVNMERAKLLRLGGYAAGVVLMVFGVGTIAIGIVGKNTVEDELSQEKIVGSPDMSPEGIAPGIEEAKLTVDAPDCDVAEEPITTGSEARCFAKYMRIHALESSGGLTYAEMGRFVSEADPSNPAGTNDEAAALKDESGKPVSNAARNTWVTETALSTALNMSYMATGVAVFSIVVGVALILAGVGFLLLAHPTAEPSVPASCPCKAASMRTATPSAAASASTSGRSLRLRMLQIAPPRSKTAIIGGTASSAPRYASERGQSALDPLHSALSPIKAPIPVTPNTIHAATTAAMISTALRMI